MNIILLAVTFLLLYSRIKNTPRLLNKKAYIEFTQKQYLSTKETLLGLDKEAQGFTLFTCYIVLTIFAILLFIYYILVGRAVGNSLFLVLSAVQVATIIPSFFHALSVDYLNPDIEKIKFHRWWFLFNIVIDYIYYLGAIYVMVCNFK